MSARKNSDSELSALRFVTPFTVTITSTGKVVSRARYTTTTTTITYHSLEPRVRSYAKETRERKKAMYIEREREREREREKGREEGGRKLFRRSRRHRLKRSKEPSREKKIKKEISLRYRCYSEY